MTPKIVAALLLLASAEAFAPSFAGSRPIVTSLEGQKQSFLYTGGSGGSSLVSEGRVDIDAPWGSNNPNLHQSRAYHHRRVQKRPGQETPAPGTTGGAHGSTFVSDVIEKDSLYGNNYHRAQGYRSSRPRSMMQRNEPALPPPQQETSRAQAPPQQQRKPAPEQKAAPQPRQMQASN